MSSKEVFMQVDELGNLYLYDVLLTYIYPRVFVCEDDFDSKYLFYEISSKENEDTWIVTKITKTEYYSLVDKEKPIQQAFKRKKAFYQYSISKTYGEKSDIITLSHDVGGLMSKLPKDPVYAEKDTVEDIAQETLAVARKTGATTLDIRLFPGTDRHSIPQNIMSDMCAAVTSITNSVFGRRRSSPLSVATAPGSCVVRFSFPDDINMFNEIDASSEMEIINEVLSSETISDGLERVADKKKFIKSYYEILDAIRKTKSDVQFTTASPNSNKVQKVALTSATVRERYNDIKGVNKIDTEELYKNGTLIALDVKTKRFKFKLEDGVIISGTVSDVFLNNGSIELPQKYYATIRVERYIRDNLNANEKFCLLGLSNIAN